MTSDHRVAGSSPAGCKSSLVNDLQAVLCPKNRSLKSTVIRLLSGFPVLLASLTAHCGQRRRVFLLVQFLNRFTIPRVWQPLLWLQRRDQELPKITRKWNL